MIRELKFHHRREMLPFLTREYPKGISRVILLRLTKYKCVTYSCVGEIRLATNSPDIKTMYCTVDCQSRNGVTVFEFIHP